MTSVVVDLTSYDPDVVLWPWSHGRQNDFSDNVGNSSRVAYGYNMWGQFMIFYKTGGNGVLVWMKEYIPRFHTWLVNSTAKTVTIEWPDDLAAPVVYQTPVTGTNWKDYLDIYKDWARTAPWYRKKHNLKYLNYMFTGGTNSASLLTTNAKEMNKVFGSGKGIFVSNCYTKHKFTLVAGTHPDYTLSADFDDSFTEIEADGIICFPYFNFREWSTDEGSYNSNNMAWGKPHGITSITDIGGGSYVLLLPSSYPTLNKVNIVVGDHFAVTNSTNSNINNVVFEVTTVTSQTNITLTQTAGLGNISDSSGYVHELYPFNRSTKMSWKRPCHYVSAVRSKYETEVANLVNASGNKTRGIYMDEVCFPVTPCWNPNHGHTAGDSRIAVEYGQSLMQSISNDFDYIAIEGFNEEWLGLADIYLFLSGTGVQDLVDVPMWDYVYGDVCFHVGWSGQSWSGTDSEWAVEMAEAATYGSHANGSYTGNATLDEDICDGTYSTAQAALVDHKPINKCYD